MQKQKQMTKSIADKGSSNKIKIMQKEKIQIVNSGSLIDIGTGRIDMAIFLER